MMRPLLPVVSYAMNPSRQSSSVLVYLVIFVLSGFSGLIYESIWSHYLKLFLGHAAYAQALVLAIFMGGMAGGAALAARLGHRVRNALLAYAVVEGLIGIMGVAFHGVFLRATDWAYADVLAQLSSPFSIELFKWVLASILILPQSLLLGATFPLMSTGLIRRNPEVAGYRLSMLYFTNSLGAALGVLASGFLLIGWVGLPGTILTAGLLNLAIALVVWLVSRDGVRSECQPVLPKLDPDSEEKGGLGGRLTVVLLIATFFSSAASFFYEIGWIRMLSMVLGSATHSFELMLSAFILGLAIGGFLIRNHIDRLKHPLLSLALIQIAMGFFATLTVPLYNFTFDIMAWAMGALARSESGYTLINLTSHGIAVLIMLPATICAGMTLPLITRILFSRGEGEKAIGKVYALNTLGAIFGVLMASLLVMPTLGLRNVVLIGAAGDVIVGLGLLVLARGAKFGSNSGVKGRLAYGAGGLAVVCFSVVALVAHFDPLKLTSGVYRSGTLKFLSGREPIAHYDGATASINVFKGGETVSIATNGKVDASISFGGTPAVDEPTMIMAALLSMIHKPSAETAAVIGFGSGYTSDTLLAFPQLKQVDTVEIEKKMVEGARVFEPVLPRVFSDPRGHIYINDAKTFFSAHQKKYDFIIAEPSNPWVSGVSSLFSKEFYSRIRSHLNEGGVYVQWIQAYEINFDLVATVLAAIQQEFFDVSVFSVGQADLVLVASPKKKLDLPDYAVLDGKNISPLLLRAGYETPFDVEASRLAGGESLRLLQKISQAASNSDYFPVLDLGAAKARYLGRDAFEVLRLKAQGFMLVEALDGHRNDYPARIPKNDQSNFAQAKILAKVGESFPSVSFSSLSEIQAKTLRNVLSLNGECSKFMLEEGWLPDFHRFMQAAMPVAKVNSLAGLFSHLRKQPCMKEAPLSVKTWVDFYEFMGRRDYAGVMLSAEKLLAVNPGMSKSDRAFVEFNGATAAALMGSKEHVEKFWGARFGKHSPIELEKFLLDAYLMEKVF